jgi:DNA-binding GntR family transcriptional regulator
MRYRCIMSATQLAYTYAKERILDGRLRGGELVSEGDIARGTGLSRTPVREAFLRLETEGLIRLYPKRGALVVPVSADEVESVMETRTLVERFAIETVIRRWIELRPEIEAALTRQESFADPERAWEFVEADHEFHRVFVAGVGNPILLALHDSMRDRQSRMGLTALMRDGDRTRRILDEHRALADAVLAGREELAVTLIDRHLAGTLALLQSSTLTPESPDDA